MAPAPRTGTRGAPRRRRALALVALCAVVVAALVARSPYAQVSPGPAPLAAPRGGGEVGSWHYTTVEVVPLTWARWAARTVSGHDSVGVGTADRTAELLAGRRARAEMSASKDAAWAASAAMVGAPAPRPEVAVTGVDPRSPAAAAGLRTGDTLVAVDGTPVTADTLVAKVRSSQGTPLRLEVRRSARTTTVVVRPARTDRTWRLGIHLADSAGAPARLPLPTPGVGGPSAGLVFALAYTEARGGGDLAAGKVVAGTGTVDAAGNVGPVGGVADKVAGAARTGATVFLVPAAEAAEAAAAAPGDMTVVAVEDLAGAVRWLCAHGGTGRACTAASR